MNAFVTGCAGFIGSHLCAKLVAEGHHVTGVDSMTDYYDRALKERNIGAIGADERFVFIEEDLLTMDFAPVREADVVFHLAGQPGVRGSWGTEFSMYVRNNITATQRLLESVKESGILKKFVFASSSSVYGETKVDKISEEHPTRPHSPYGVTKLAAENLCFVYHKTFGLPLTALRFFSVFGPRQRPDMAFSRLIQAALTGSTFTIYGDGSQERDFTYVGDVVEGMLLAAEGKPEGEVFNIGGGEVLSLNSIVDLIRQITGRPINLLFQPGAKGDVPRTSADIAKMRRQLGFHPNFTIGEGLARQVQEAQQAMKRSSGGRI